MVKNQVIRIEDVARKAGVSPASVSNAFNHRWARISPETRNRIFAVAARLNYTPNAAASSLRNRRTRSIGTVVTNILNPFYTAVVRAIQDAARRVGYSVIVCNTDDNVKQEQEMLQVLRAKQIDGLLLVTAGSNPQLKEALSAGTPVVLLDRHHPSLHLDTVRVDNEAAAREAIEYLILLGHRRIGLLSGPAVGIPTRLARIDGYNAALKQSRIATHERYRKLVATDAESGFRATRELLSLRHPPTALFVANTCLAVGALDAIHRSGLRIPADISFLMFDDPDWGRLLTPPVTAVAQPTQRIGQAAFDLLWERLEGATGPPKEVVIATQFMLRSSCGDPRSER